MCETSKCTVNIKRIQLFLESEQIYKANLHIYTRYILCHLFENGKVFLLQSSNYSCIKFNSVSFFNLFIKVIFFLSPFCKYDFIVTITHMVFSYDVLIWCFHMNFLCLLKLCSVQKHNIFSTKTQYSVLKKNSVCPIKIQFLHIFNKFIK